MSTIVKKRTKEEKRKDLLLYLDYMRKKALESFEKDEDSIQFSLSTDVIEAPSEGDWKCYAPGRYTTCTLIFMK